jgi:hypothetical protein
MSPRFQRTRYVGAAAALVAAAGLALGAGGQSATTRAPTSVITHAPGTVAAPAAGSQTSSTTSTMRPSPVVGRLPRAPVAFLPVGGGLSTPQAVTTPFELKTISTAVVPTPGVASTTLLTVQNPAVSFRFPIIPDMDYWNGSGLYHGGTPSIGITATVALEACLTAQEATAWTGATLIGADAATCGTEDDLVHAKILQRAWYQVASAYADEYVIQNNTADENSPLAVPINVQQIDTPVRFHIKGFTYYYGQVHTGPNDYNAACPPQHCGNGNFEMRTSPITLVVLPAFMFQLKVLPQTIVYQPPGNTSFGRYTVTETYATTLSAGATTEVDNSTSDDQWIEDTTSNQLTGGIDKILSLGFSSSDDTRWDTKTTAKAGQASEHDVQVVNQTQNSIQFQVGPTSADVPGPGGTVATESFWGDSVVLLVHPQFAVWDFFGRTSVQLVGASDTPTFPDEISETIIDLDSCANGTGAFAAGIPFTAADGTPDQLTTADCRNLAAIDPFYGVGQSADVSRRGTLFMGPQMYGVDVVGNGTPRSFDPKTISSQQVTVTNTSTQTYAATVEDIVATTQSQGLQIGASAPISGLTLGLTQSFTLKQGSTTDTSQTMNLTYKNSSATQVRTDIAVEGSISDNQHHSYEPQVAVYLDNVFGGFMSVDSQAPKVPCKPQPACNAIAPNGGTTNTLAR